MTSVLPRRQTSFVRLAGVLLPCLAISVGLMAGIAEGAIPVSLAVSSGGFKIGVGVFSATNFEQFGSTVKHKDGSVEPVALTAVSHADLDHLCQTVAMKLPLINKTVVLKITGGDQGSPVVATDMIIAASAQRGDALFKNIVIGADGSTLTQYPKLESSAGSFGLESDTIVLNHLQQDSLSVTAGTFTIPHLNLSVSTGNVECY
jgi:hypothetical protein